METSWTTRLLLLLAVTLDSIAAVPEEGHLNLTDDPGLEGLEHNLHSLGVTSNKIMTAQYECYQKIMQAPANTIEGKGRFFVTLQIEMETGPFQAVQPRLM
uniref:Uncharacterized protein n=1 Tax=Sphaerodactylus townsendi TaxID=933632 RepID=A0ACB8G0A2_9SAUR